MKYEICTNTEWLGIIDVPYLSVTMCSEYLQKYGYVLKNTTPVVDLDGSWYFDDCKYHFKGVNDGLF